jgi:hypothetical protein
MGLIGARAATVAEECGVEQLDLRPVVTPSLRHYYDHTHFTPAGAALVARAVANVLLRRPAPTERPLGPIVAVGAVERSSASANS